MSATQYKPLNKSLYGRLTRAFGRVTVAHAGEAFDGTPVSSADMDMVVQTGEWYRVSCPHCQDTRRRLWVHHLWGVPDDDGNAHWDMATCFNRDCMANEANLKSLIRAVYKGSKPTLRTKPKIREGVVVRDWPLTMTSQREVTPLSALTPSHPAIQCLRSRGFDPAYLQQRFSVGYWSSSINIPVFRRGELVTELSRPLRDDIDWRPKSNNQDPRNAVKKAVLYNFDAASTLPWAILVEHIVDVWRMGDHAVAPLARPLSERHAHQIAETWPVLISLVDDDYYDAAARPPC